MAQPSGATYRRGLVILGLVHAHRQSLALEADGERGGVARKSGPDATSELQQLCNLGCIMNLSRIKDTR